MNQWVNAQLISYSSHFIARTLKAIINWIIDNWQTREQRSWRGMLGQHSLQSCKVFFFWVVLMPTAHNSLHTILMIHYIINCKLTSVALPPSFPQRDPPLVTIRLNSTLISLVDWTRSHIMLQCSWLRTTPVNKGLTPKHTKAKGQWKKGKKWLNFSRTKSWK